MKIIEGFEVTENFLNDNPNIIFVFGDNCLRVGKGGAAILRDHRQALGFITKIRPSYRDEDYFRPEEYKKVYKYEIKLLIKEIATHPKNFYYISKLGAGLANKYGIWESIIEPNLKNDLKDFENVTFLW